MDQIYEVDENTQDLRTLMAQMRRLVNISMSVIENEELLQEVSKSAPYFKSDYPYKINEVFAWGVNGVGDPQLYRVVQAHTSALQWLPSENPALYKPIGLTEDGIPIWANPTGAHDAYDLNDKVSYHGVIYQSLIAANTTVPGTDDRWWKKVSGAEPEPGPGEEIPDWVQPTGGHNAYNIGDKVRYTGSIYESLINANTTIPGTDDRWWKKVA